MSIFQAETDLLHEDNLVALGLLIWQSVHSMQGTRELQKMETGHIHLKGGTVYIPSTRRKSAKLKKKLAIS